MNAEESQVLDDLKKDINELLGFHEDTPRINYGPCGAFAKLFFDAWNARFQEKVHIVFVMMTTQEECWHIAIRLPGGELYDGGIGIHNEATYGEGYLIEDMLNYDHERLEKWSYGLERDYPRFCPKFDKEAVNTIIVHHLERLTSKQNHSPEEAIQHLITIDYLKHHPRYISKLAEIWHEVLGQIWAPDVSISRVEENLRNHLNTEQLPLTFIAFDDKNPVGMCSLRINDGIRPDLTPWLGSLVVASVYQKQGIAKQLIDKTKDKARQMGFEKLYLFAFDQTIPDYYSRLGWTKIAMDECRGHPVTVMEITL